MDRIVGRVPGRVVGRMASIVAVVFLCVGVARAEDPRLARGRELLRSASLKDRVEGVKLLGEADSAASIQPLEDLIRKNVKEMEKEAKLLDQLDVRYDEALRYWEQAQDSGSREFYDLAKQYLARVETDWKARALRLRALLSISVFAGETFGQFQSDGAVAAVEQGARTESDLLVKQWYVRGLAGPTRRRSAPVLAKLLAGSDPMGRALAAKALAPAVIDRTVFDALAAATRDKAWQVRLAACLGIARAPIDHAVPVLVEAVQREDGEVARSIDSLLRSLVGVGFPDAPKAWGDWWKAHGDEVREGTWTPPPPQEREAPLTVETFFSLPIESTNVAFVLDLSGSMNDDLDLDDARNRELRAELRLPATRTGVAKAETVRAIRGLPDGARFSIIVFSDKARRMAARPLVASGGTRASAIAWVLQQKTGWLTNVWDGLRLGFDDLYGPGGSSTRFLDLPDTVILLSDGTPTRGRFQDDESLVSLVRLWNQPVGAVVHTVGIGDDAPKDLLAVLARSTGGMYLDVIARKAGVERVRPVVPADAVHPPVAVAVARAREVFEAPVAPADRVWAVRLAGSLADWSPDALAMTAEALDHADAPVRDAAATVLGSIHPSLVAPVLEHLLPHLKRGAECQDDGASASLRVLAAYGAAAAPMVPTVVEVATAASSGHRVEAVATLGAIGPPAKAAVPALVAIKAEPDATPELKAAVDAALSRIRR